MPMHPIRLKNRPQGIPGVADCSARLGKAARPGLTSTALLAGGCRPPFCPLHQASGILHSLNAAANSEQ